MKARLNVLGRKSEVVTISYYNGEITSATIVDDKGILKTYYDTANSLSPESSLTVDMKEALEFPDVEARIQENNEKLIERLVEMHEEESEKLIGIAVDAMEDESSQPFNTHLSTSQKEYKLMQQRVLGIIDTIEEARAFQDGWFDKQEVKQDGDTV